MIVGVITANREAVISFSARDQNGHEREIQAVIDTGFTGYLTLPDTLVDAIGLSYHSPIIAILGDGSNRVLSQYEARVLWDGQERDVLVLAADGGPLVGMAMLYGHGVYLNVVDDGTVTVQAVSP